MPGSQQHQSIVLNMIDKDSKNLSLHDREVATIDDLQMQLSQMEKMAAIGQLSSSVAHEMRNLLGVIRTAAFNIDRAIRDQDTSLKNNVDVINRSVSRAREFIENLLNLSRVSMKNEEIVDICEVVDHLLILFSKELEWRNIELHREYHRFPPFRLDRNALQECLLNLMLNAIQSMENGGQIKVEIAPFRKGLRVSIHDTGCGIPPENLKKIFNRFYTSKKNGQGTGLGLSIVRSLANELGGYIEVESDLGKGSSFSIIFPNVGSDAKRPDSELNAVNSA